MPRPRSSSTRSRRQTKAEVVVYTQALGRDDITTEEAEADAQALMDQWGVGRHGLNDGLVILFDLDTILAATARSSCSRAGVLGVVPARTRSARRSTRTTMLPLARGQQFDDALLGALGEVVEATFDGRRRAATRRRRPAPVIRPGPPFPDPEVDRAVYDFAGHPVARRDRQGRGDDRRDRGADRRRGRRLHRSSVDYGVTTEETEARARALIDQWGIGRQGFDDGLVIFFDIDPSGEHGQVQLYAAPGFEAAYLSNSERQTIFDDDMVPFLRDGRLRRRARRSRSRRSTPRRRPSTRQRCRLGRQVNAVVGLIGAPIVFLGLAGWAFFSWLRYGKDPVYLDDPSILMPAPPPDLTAASGRVRHGRRPSRRALTTAMLDLASRGLLAFREDKRAARAVEQGRRRHRARRRRRDRGGAARAERAPADRPGRGLRARASCATLGDDGRASSSPTTCPSSARSVAKFDDALEDHVVERRLVRPRSRARSSRAGRSRRRSRSSSGVVARSSSGSNLPSIRARPHRRGGDRRRRRDHRCSRGACRA